MASKEATVALSNSKNTSANANNSSKDENVKAKSGTGKKSVKSSGAIVKSRYMQSASMSTLSKSNSMINESVAMAPRPSSPKPSFAKPKVALSFTPMAASTASMSTFLDHSRLGKGILQSTFADGHHVAPDFDVSFHKEEQEMAEMKKEILAMQTLDLAYLTAKKQHSNAKLAAQAEQWLLEAMEEEERLYTKVQEKKKKYLLMERMKQIHETLDLQIATLTPLANESKQFTEKYQTFAAAIDTTRHELPVKNCYVEGDGRDFLEKAELSLGKSEKVLIECTHTALEDSSAAVEGLRDMKTAAEDIAQQLLGTFSEVLELSSLVRRNIIHTQQASEEDRLGTARTRELYWPKP
ncbi:hypothetical protein NHX12_033216 [Muraenolepis orangiensis]|uniref:HAUS augmin-like complex subunit 8 n=1 Tax=Muraenolepis orangiensis TaxID=630683 RepID=A0A9Q0E538_9TELE|nr:hypothetical protein NHX12_033216 [Muraenolepis orangiensis]